jgi:hypothetical protein
VRKITFTLPVGGYPFGENGLFDPPHGLHLGNARIGHPIHMTLEQRLLVGRLTLLNKYLRLFNKS